MIRNYSKTVSVLKWSHSLRTAALVLHIMSQVSRVHNIVFIPFKCRDVSTGLENKSIVENRLVLFGFHSFSQFAAVISRQSAKMLLMM